MSCWQSWITIATVLAVLGIVNGFLLFKPQQKSFSDNQIVQLFQEYIQINSTTGNDLTPVVQFWRQLAKEEKVSFNAYEYTPGYPVIVMRWPGTDSSLRSIMLNSHMDVVPANEEDGWTYPPFAARIVDGVMWGRGTQDMKSVTMQHFVALKRLRDRKVKLLRDVYLTIQPDEEVGSPNGLNKFLASKEFHDMNIGFDLDEGAFDDVPIIPVFYQDKVVWQFQVDCYGTASHGSTFLASNDTATGQCRNVMNILFAFRDQEYTKYLASGIFASQGYTSLNLNKIEAGTANNIVPRRVTLTYDMRLATTVDEIVLEQQLYQWMREAGPNVTLTFLEKDRQSPATVLNYANPYWIAIQETASVVNKTFTPIVLPGSSDARFVRKAGYPALGLSALPNTESLAHQVNERLSLETLLDNIVVYETLVEKLANIPADATSDNPTDYLIATAGST